MILKPVAVEYMEIIDENDIVQLANDLEAYPIHLDKKIPISIETPKALIELLELSVEDTSYTEWYDLQEEILEEILRKSDSLWGMAYQEDTGFWIVHSIDEEAIKDNFEQYKKYVANRNDRAPKMGALAVRTEEWQANQSSL